MVHQSHLSKSRLAGLEAFDEAPAEAGGSSGRRRRGPVAQMPPLEEVLRGTLAERYLRRGKRNCGCARGDRHDDAFVELLRRFPLWARLRLRSSRFSRDYQRQGGTQQLLEPYQRAPGALPDRKLP